MVPIHVSNHLASEISEKSIFLAGPSPRGNLEHHWRPMALEILSARGFNGSVFVPLQADGSWLNNYNLQIDWELYYLNLATVILFWIPRDLSFLPGFIANVEYGMFIKSGKIVLGYPQHAPKLGYLNYLAQLNLVPVCHDLEPTVLTAIDLVDALS